MNQPIFLSTPINTMETYYKELRNLLRIKKINDCDFIRMGNTNDGGYIMLDWIYKNGIAYSFGINDDVSWDLSMATCDYDVFMYDHTIPALPQENIHFHFFREGIAGKTSQPTNMPMDTLENFIIRNQHMTNRNMILKMDVEGAEWDVLDSVSTNIMEQFDQVIIELHKLCTSVSWDDMAQIIRGLENINKTHTLVHLHGNNTGIAVKTDVGYFPDTMEATYARTSSHDFSEDDDILLPISLDAPNSSGHAEIPLGYWNRR